MDLIILEQNLETNNNFQNNYCLAIFWFNKQQYDKTLLYLDSALEHDSESYDAIKLKSDTLFCKSQLNIDTPEEIRILNEALKYVERANEIDERHEDNYYLGVSDVKRRLNELSSKN